MQQLWNHLAYRPDKPPLLGSVTRLKGGQARGKGGWSDVHHYEITGAGRIDYQFHPEYSGGANVTLIRLSRSSASICPATDGAKCAAALRQTLGCAQHLDAFLMSRTR